MSITKQIAKAARVFDARAVTLVVFTAGVAASLAARQRSERDRAVKGSSDDVRRVLVAETDSLDSALVRLSSAIGVVPEDTTRIRAEFRAARGWYKHIEGAAEFYAPALAGALNSRRQEVDDEDAPPPSMLAPSGFPALEDVLWPVPTRALADSAQRLTDAMHPAVAKLRELAKAITPTEPQIVELTRLELVRLSTLGIAGFDAPRTGDAMRETASALDGIRVLYQAAAERWPSAKSQRLALDSALAAAITYLDAHEDFVSFDRLAFLVDYEEPAAHALDRLRRAVVAVPIDMPRGLRADAPSPYAANAFDPRAYAPRSAPLSSAQLVALGRRLFFDPELSGTDTRACASCHVPSHAFTDGLPKAASLAAHGGTVARNTPTLINAALEPAQFDDERAVSLEDQIFEVLRSPTEMASSVDRVSRVLGADASYAREFRDAFADTQTAPVTPLRVRQALAAYVRSLVALNSRFDRAVRGDTSAMTSEERHGFNLFMGKAGCGTCHVAPLFSGSMPPRYLSSDVEVIGTPTSPTQFTRLDVDSGRARIDHLPQHLRGFKTPTLRNIELTAPYMHHGAFMTLGQVLDFYNAGGGQGAGARISNQTLAPDSLHLSAPERRAVIAFLKTLTDTVISPAR